MRRRFVGLGLALVLGVDLFVLASDVGPTEQAVATVPSSTTTTSSSTTTTLPPTTTTVTTLPAPAPAPRQRYYAEPIRTIGSMEIPKLGLRSPLGEGISLHNIDRGPSHWPGTAMPGQPGNVVVAGHRVTHTRPFRHIDQLVPGDEVFFEVGGVRSRYVVTGHEVVTPDRVDIVRQTAEPTATLFACHPPGSARYRYVVRLKLA
jgi:sortase A